CLRVTCLAVSLLLVVLRCMLQSSSDRLAWFQGARRTIEAGLGLLFLCLAAAVACHPPPAVGSFAVVCSRVHVDRGLVARRAGISPGGKRRYQRMDRRIRDCADDPNSGDRVPMPFPGKRRGTSFGWPR